MNSPLTITRWGRVQRGSSFYCIKSARQTDTLVIKSIDRLGRNYDDILEQWCFLAKEKQVPESFKFKEIPICDFQAGCRPVKTMLFGSRTVWALVTKSKKGNYRLFLCTKDPKELRFDLSLTTEKAAMYADADPDFLPLTIYALRWNIEVSYYEQKTFWNLGDYRLRSQTGMERLVNLITVCYSAVQILPYLSEDFHTLIGMSPYVLRKR